MKRTKTNVIIFGSGDIGAIVHDILSENKIYNIVGFIDDPDKAMLSVSKKILGTDLDIAHISNKCNVSNAVIAIGDNYLRKKLALKVQKLFPFFTFLNVFHPSAVFSKTTQIGKGNIFMPGVIINTNAVIGDFCLLNTGSSIDHDSKMSNFSSLAPGVVVGGNSVIGESTAISLQTGIINNIQVGSNTVIGAGSVVLTDIPANVIAYGVPCKVIRKRKRGEKYF